MSPQFTSKSPTIRRILREAAEISNGPSADYTAEPLESDLFEWHFTLRGPPNSPYSDGLYHGRIVLPPTYPLRPPSFRFTTPNGRFEANREICLSISGHHEETWQPAWGIRTAIVALRSFMETDARGQLGGLDTTDAVRRRLASESPAFRCSTCSRSNAEIIHDSEARAQKADSASQDVEVPKELNMAWKDEMAAKPPDTQDSPPGLPESEDEPDSAELAEGYVQTEQIPTTARAIPSPPTAQPLPRQVTNPTRTFTATPQRLPQQQHTDTGQLRRAQDAGVPLWMDRAIVALVIVLSALVLKVLIGV